MFTKKSLTAVLLGLFLSAISHAGLITDPIQINKKLKFGQSVAWEHDIGAQLGSDTAVSGRLTLNFKNGDSFWDLADLATIIVGEIDFQDGSVLWSVFGGNDYTGNVGDNSIDIINNTGSLWVKVANLIPFTKFKLLSSTLEVRTASATAVPEPASIALIAIGMIGLYAARRKS